MSTFLLLCPTHRDRRGLGRLPAASAHTFVPHEYATTALEQMTTLRPRISAVADAQQEVERILARCRRAGVDGVLSTDDYPGSMLASIVAQQLGLPGVAPSASLICQHKYHARVAQQRVLPQLVPRFELLDAHQELGLGVPCFIKPVKSCFSAGAYRVDRPDQLPALRARATLPEPFFAPFRRLFERYVGRPFGDGRILAEELLQGQQVTVEGYAFEGRAQVIGIVDAVMFPGTLSFRRFQYPSVLPARVQERMTDAAVRLMQGLGFDHGLFNVEMMVDLERDSIHIIEINPRMASQFADLYEKVDGFNTYTALLDLGLGRAPRPLRRAGTHRVALSQVLRRFDDARVLRVPSAEDVQRLQRDWPDVRVEVLATEGLRLSDELQDGRSYRYGIVNVGGSDVAHALATADEVLRRLDFVFDDDG